ncbi:LicD family protein [uncultured Alistipes sp.]|uniref:LicD family protein n=1 Tax=uncultured Alistipes sp. TaxID=538949 RepID=UPI0025E99AFA|nr:LicD family protein [uncultured Alistipes sp.]
MTDITAEELDALHRLNLEMAEVFVAFCKRHGLLCYLCGGGCIGAVRHKGWIPWDDDLDFFMPRDDYEKAIRLWREEMQDGRYKLEKSDEHHIDGNLFFVIRDSQTTYVKPYQADMEMTHGIVLDVLPLDGYPDSRIARAVQCFWALIYSLYRAQMVPENHGKWIRWAGKALLAAVPSRALRYKISSYAERRMTRHRIDACHAITELCSGPGYMKNRYPKEAFAESLFLPFEETRMPVPVGYDRYLTIAFGDYMRMPPAEKQRPSHDVAFMDLTLPYDRYRGKKYLVRK